MLWDVDHTLIENGGVSKEVYAAALESLTGRPATERVETDGRTDPVIMGDLLAKHGSSLSYDEHVRKALVEALNSKTDRLRERGHALPGAVAALEALRQDSHVVQSVLTGNIQPNAVVKLAVFGLDRFVDFDVGGYGSDDSIRSRLVRIAQLRAEKKYAGRGFTRSNTVIIGDTTRDVQTGLEGGGRVVAVATGPNSVAELRTAGAAVVLTDLVDTAAVLRAVLEGHRTLAAEESA
ncbi:haloacid dehalogenase-like hydrolase [Candidatus Nephthysia bennettiae]|uniref:haloacid dehalogenase-like hydrolase n=1 Tax=Candidatus Nephthysia bennettiae TaxID=3127016 RepID=UPI0030C7097C